MTFSIPAGAGNVTSAGNGNTTYVVVPVPANKADGDCFIAVVYHQLSGATLTGPPAGWTEIYHAVGTGTRPHYVFYKKITNAAAEPASYTWTFSGLGRNCGNIFRVLGLGDAVVDAYPTVDTFPAGNAPSIAGVTAVAANAIHVGCIVTNNSTLIYPVPDSVGFTTVFNNQVNNGSGTSISNLIYKELSAAGPTGNIPLTWSGGTATNSGIWSFTLQAAAVVVPPVVEKTPLEKWALRIPAYTAHRNGFYATHGEFTIKGYQALLAWNPAVAWNIDVFKTLDGVWVASHDATTGRVLSGTSVDIRTVNWADISSKTTLVGGNPVATLDQIVAIAPYGTIFYIDNKGNSNQTELLAKLQALNLTPANTVIKNFAGSNANNTWARANNYQIWMYFFDGDVATYLANLLAPDWVGFDYNGTQPNWNTVIATGRPSFAHILPSLAAKTTADTKAQTAGGSNFGYMVSNVEAVVPKGATTIPTLAELKRKYWCNHGSVALDSKLSTTDIEWQTLQGWYGAGDLNYLRRQLWSAYVGSFFSDQGIVPTLGDLKSRAMRVELALAANSNHTLNDLEYMYYTVTP